MNRKYILSDGIFLVLVGVVSTSISTDGIMMVASSGNNENGSFTSRNGRRNFLIVQDNYRR
jgi:hypothetical protein